METINITAKNPRQLNNIKYLLEYNEGATYESLEKGAVQVVKYTRNGNPVAAIFRDKKKDPIAHYRYGTEERRDEAIQEQVDNFLKMQKYKEERKNRPNVQLEVGDLLYTSWGYEQTNIDFYKVVGLVGKATAEYVKIGSTRVEETSWCSATCTPNPDVTHGDVRRGRIGVYGVKIDNVYGHASKIKLGDTFHESWGY